MPQERQRGMRAVRTAGRAAVLAASLALVGLLAPSAIGGGIAMAQEDMATPVVLSRHVQTLAFIGFRHTARRWSGLPVIVLCERERRHRRRARSEAGAAVTGLEPRQAGRRPHEDERPHDEVAGVGERRREGCLTVPS